MSFPPARYLLVTGIGIGVGSLSGLLGVGGGVVAVPALVLVLGFGQQMAQGTSLLMILPTALTAAVTYSAHRSSDLWAAVAMIVGSVPAAHFGARVALGIPESTLRTVFSLFIAAMAVCMVPKPRLGPLAAVAGLVLILAGLRLVIGR